MLARRRLRQAREATTKIQKGAGTPPPLTDHPLTPPRAAVRGKLARMQFAEMRRQAAAVLVIQRTLRRIAAAQAELRSEAAGGGGGEGGQ